MVLVDVLIVVLVDVLIVELVDEEAVSLSIAGIDTWSVVLSL